MFKPTVEAALERFDDAQMMAAHLGAVKPQHDVLLLEGDTIRRDVGELTLKQHDPDHLCMSPSWLPGSPNWNGLPARVLEEPI